MVATGAGAELFGIARRQIPARVTGERTLGGNFPPELRVGPCAIVVGPPTSECDKGLDQRREQGLVEQFIPQPTVKALDEGILRRLARRDVVPFRPYLITNWHVVTGRNARTGKQTVIARPDMVLAMFNTRIMILERKPTRSP